MQNPDFHVLCDALSRLRSRIISRASPPPPGAAPSYTRELLRGGTARIAKKLGEEAVEVAIAAVTDKPDVTCREIADLLYHLLVLMHALGIHPDAVGDELERRSSRSGIDEHLSRDR